jgi:hypothetical protein
MPASILHGFVQAGILEQCRYPASCIVLGCYLAKFLNCLHRGDCMKQKNLTKEQLELLEGTSADMQEMSVSDMLGVAGGCHKHHPTCGGTPTTPTPPPTTPPVGGYGSPL